MNARLAAVATVAWMVGTTVPAGAQTPLTLADVQESLNDCLYEVSIRPAAADEKSFSFLDRSGNKFAQVAGAPVAIVAGALRVSGPRIVTEGDVPGDPYTVRVCDPLGVGDGVRTALRRGLGLEVTDARRRLEVLVLRVAPGGTRPGLEVSGPDETQSLRMMRSSVQARSTPIAGLIGILENLLGKPVVDDSGLAANYSFALTFDRSDPGTVVDALSRQLGLVLEADTREIPVTLVRRVQR